MLVVGGGDSALEAATSIARETGTDVVLSYRSAAFTWLTMLPVRLPECTPGKPVAP